MKVEFLLNECYGGFSVSEEAIHWIAKNCNRQEAVDEIKKNSEKKHDWEKHWGLFFKDIRFDKDLIACYKVLGSKRVSGACSKLVLDEINIVCLIESRIKSCDGRETFDGLF